MLTGKPLQIQKLTIKLYHISIGVLLGDASIQKNNSKTQTKHRLKFLQSAKHKEFFKIKNCILPYVLDSMKYKLPKVYKSQTTSLVVIQNYS